MSAIRGDSGQCCPRAVLQSAHGLFRRRTEVAAKSAAARSAYPTYLQVEEGSGSASAVMVTVMVMVMVVVVVVVIILTAANDDRVTRS